jgi:CheY-like chemotaxis protein
MLNGIPPRRLFLFARPAGKPDGAVLPPERSCHVNDTSTPGALRVLVADDNEDAADSLLMLLACWGHHARAAYDGRSALALVREFRPDVALLDLAMPGLSGWNLARLLRADPATRGTLLLALTGYGREEEVWRALDAGFHGHLLKPVDLPTLRGLLGGEAAALARNGPGRVLALAGC